MYDSCNIYIYIYIHIHTHIYIYIYTYTHIRIHIYIYTLRIDSTDKSEWQGRCLVICAGRYLNVCLPMFPNVRE